MMSKDNSVCPSLLSHEQNRNFGTDLTFLVFYVPIIPLLQLLAVQFRKLVLIVLSVRGPADIFWLVKTLVHANHDI
jgi:hypothetical protein